MISVLKNTDIKKLPEMAANAEKSNKKLIKLLIKNRPKDLDKIVHYWHYKAFETYDCLDCGNCCISLGPRIAYKDIEKLSKSLRMKQQAIIDKFLKVDEDNDFVFASMPCPFLADGNYCLVYDNRPKACREYPHTDRKHFYQILDLSLKNTFVCPVVFLIFEKLRKKYL